MLTVRRRMVRCHYGMVVLSMFSALAPAQNDDRARQTGDTKETKYLDIKSAADVRQSISDSASCFACLFIDADPHSVKVEDSLVPAELQESMKAAVLRVLSPKVLASLVPPSQWQIVELSSDQVKVYGGVMDFLTTTQPVDDGSLRIQYRPGMLTLRFEYSESVFTDLHRMTDDQWETILGWMRNTFNLEDVGEQGTTRLWYKLTASGIDFVTGEVAFGSAVEAVWQEPKDPDEKVRWRQSTGWPYRLRFMVTDSKPQYIAVDMTIDDPCIKRLNYGPRRADFSPTRLFKRASPPLPSGE